MLIFCYGDDYYGDKEQVEYILKMLAGFDGKRSFLNHGMKANIEVVGDSSIMSFLRDSNIAKYMRSSNAFTLEGRNINFSEMGQKASFDFKTRAPFLRKVVEDDASQIAIEKKFVDDYTVNEMGTLSQLVVVIPAEMVVSFLREAPYMFEKVNYFDEIFLPNGIVAYNGLIYSRKYLNAVSKTLRNLSPVQYANRRVEDLRNQREEECKG